MFEVQVPAGPVIAMDGWLIKVGKVPD